MSFISLITIMLTGATAFAGDEQDAADKPFLVSSQSMTVSAQVEEINLQTNTYKLKGPDGSVNEYLARNPENLRRAAVSDLVVMTFTESVAVSVEVGPQE